MKYIIFVLTLIMSVSAFAQDASPVKLDGTKYYLQVYDGVTNEKVVYYNPAGPGWSQLINVADYFDGSDAQLWSFEESPNFPGYFLVRNRDESVFSTHSLMSWSWNAYLATDESRPPLNEVEKQFRFVEAYDGYYILETIEKPTDGSSYGIMYTPGADAMNVNESGIVSFRDVKTTDITRDNMANKVFKIVEFNPLKLFDDAIVRGDGFYNANPDAPEKVRYDMFYQLEKAREIRVFGSDADILAHQPVLDSVTNLFNTAIGTVNAIDDARNFIDTVAVSAETKASFNLVVDGVEVFMNDDNLDYSEITAVQAKLDAAIALIDAVVAANDYAATLTEADSLLVSGIGTSVENAGTLLANSEATTDMFADGVTHLEATQAVIDEIIIANDTIAGTEGFEEAKAELTAVVDAAIMLINTEGTPSADVSQAADDVKDAVKAFIRAMEAGDILLELKNADFEAGLDDWNVDSPTPGRAYPENKGVDGSRSITFYSGAAYQMKVFQSISGIPNGTYIVSCFAKVNKDNSIAVFAQSGDNTVMLPVAGNALEQRVIEIEVTNGMLEFGVKGATEDNSIPGANWIVFDEFEVKLSSDLTVKNGDIEDGLTDWLVEGVTAAAYPENKGVDGSRSITTWRGQPYEISVSQTITGLTNGYYTVSAMAKTNQDSAFVVFGESAGVAGTAYVVGGALTKFQAVVEVSDGTLKFGLRGAGEGNTVPASRWIVFDNVEVARMPDVPVVNGGFDSDLADWIVESPTPAAAYAQNRGIDASRSITWWKGSAYQMKVYQSVSNMLNGTYAISCVYRNSAEGSIGLFAESGASSVDLPLPLYNNGEQDLTKAEIEITVTDGTLSFGIRGQDVDNGVPAGNWIVYDDIALKIKSIIPVYEDFVPTPAQNLLTDVNVQDIENKVTFWQANQRLNIRSTDAIIKYSVYSITGAMVEQKETRNTTLSIPMRKGIFIVRVLTESGFVDTEKVSIR